MSANHQSSEAAPPERQAKRLRRAGILVLLLGLATAGMLYWIRTHTGPNEDDLLAGNAKAESYQMEMLYGKMGLLTHKLSEALKQPGTQACLIAAVSVLTALGCFYVARLSEGDDNSG